MERFDEKDEFGQVINSSASSVVKEVAQVPAGGFVNPAKPGVSHEHPGECTQPDSTTPEKEARLRQIEQVFKAVEQEVGPSPSITRPPFGHGTAMRWAAELPLQVLTPTNTRMHTSTRRYATEAVTKGLSRWVCMMVGEVCTMVGEVTGLHDGG